jgi:hypothetical protein
MGVNLSAETVYLETVKYSSGMYGGRPSLVPVSRAEFDNMSGRAGRLGADSPPAGKAVSIGRAIVLADSEFDRDILWESYIAADNPESIKSVFLSQSLDSWMLNVIVAGLADSVESLQAVYSHSLYSVLESGGSPLPFDAGALWLAAAGFIERSKVGETLAPTVLGKAVASSGLSVASAKCYLSQLDAGRPYGGFGWIAMALNAPDWVPPPGFLTRLELAQKAPVKMLYQEFEHALDQAACLLPENYRKERISYRQGAALKAVMALECWRNLGPAQRLEERFQAHLGQIMALGENAAHLLSSLALLIAARDQDDPVIKELGDYAFSLRFGFPVKFKAIQDKFGNILSRADYISLDAAGIDSLTSLCDQTPEALKQVIVNDAKLKKMNDKIETVKQEVYMDTGINSAVTKRFPFAPFPGGKLESIDVDGSQEGERYVIRINGMPVRLTGKSFKYLVKLAWFRAYSSSGWVYKEDIEMGYNQARYLYRMKNEICACMSQSLPLVENNRLGYYRLNVEPGRIRIDLDNLRNHPDFELRQLVSNESKAG